MSVSYCRKRPPIHEISESSFAPVGHSMQAANLARQDLANANTGQHYYYALSLIINRLPVVENARYPR